MAETIDLTPERILRHPNFQRSREAYISALLPLYEFKPAAVELMLDGGRIMSYAAIMALWGSYQHETVETLPTIRLLKETIGRFAVASPRQIDLILARFAQVGHVEITPAPNDLRMRVVLPTPALIEHDRTFIQAHFSALEKLAGRDSYARPLRGDLHFLKAMRGAWIARLSLQAKDLLAASPSVLRFYTASAGMLMLMKLVEGYYASPDGWLALSQTDFGRRFGVSRTHVRTLLKTASAFGDLEWDTDGRLRLKPELLAAFDRNFAFRMSLLHRAHEDAMIRLPHLRLPV